jgi:tRNA threonylcarbamoyl adenosine modification protein YeaZ
MTILALEFSTEQRTVAILQRVAGVSPAVPASIARSDSRDIGGLTLVEDALRNAGVERETVGCIAVGLGPGSYTGIRSGIALAQGWQLVRDVKLVGVSSVDCLAEMTRQQDLLGRVNFVIDAQRDEFYLAAYEIDANRAEVVEPLRLATHAEVHARERAGELIVGPEVTRWFSSGKTLIPDAGVLAALAAHHSNFVPGEKMEPIYLREVKFVKAPPPRRIE